MKWSYSTVVDYAVAHKDEIQLLTGYMSGTVLNAGSIKEVSNDMVWAEREFLL